MSHLGFRTDNESINESTSEMSTFSGSTSIRQLTKRAYFDW